MENISRFEIVIMRVFDAPRELVWKAWTDPEYVKRWWGPKDFTAPFVKIDFRLGGGSYHYCMRSPDGKDYWSRGFYREILPPERIVCTDSFSDKDGNIVPASQYGMKGDWPLELLVKVEFEDLKGKTRFTLCHSGFPTEENSGLAKTGWNQSLDKFAAVLSAVR